MTTVLDPAHGGTSSSGKSTPEGRPQRDGRAEKHATLDLARLLCGQLGDQARLTREDDRNPSLGERIDVARRAQAKVFLSLHVHPPGGSRRRGSSAWIHTGAGDASAHLAGLVQREITGLPPETTSLEIPRGDLAVLTPDRHDPATAACLVDLEVATGDDTHRLIAALGRAVQAHAARYGRGRVAVALAGEEIVFADSEAALTYIADTMQRETNFLAGVGNTRIFPFSAICKLYMTDLNGDQWEGSGCYIANDLILTCGHNLHYYGNTGSPVGTRSVEVVPALNGTDRPFGAFTVAGSACHVHPSWFNGSSYNMDYDLAVIQVSVPAPNNVFFDYLDDSLTSRSTIAVVGYAAHGVDPTRMHFDIDWIREINEGSTINRASFQARARKGTSGSPVFWVQSVDDPVQQVCRMETGICGVVSTAGDTHGNTSDGMNTCCLMTPEKTAWIYGRTYGRRGNTASTRAAPTTRAVPARRIVSPGRTTAMPRQPVRGFGNHGVHERYGRKPKAKGLEEPYFTDGDQLGAQLDDRRTHDSRQVSSIAGALYAVQNFRGVGGAGAWSSLSRDTVADDLRTLLSDPDTIQQAGLGLCGPASFLNMWAKRDPEAVANFAITLFEQGASQIGSTPVSPRNEVLINDYAALQAALASRQKGIPSQACWMMMAALRDDENALFPYIPADGYVGNYRTRVESDEITGTTTPEEIAGWMNATGIWDVRNEASWTRLTAPGFPHAEHLYGTDGLDITLMINTNLMIGEYRISETEVDLQHAFSTDDRFVLSEFPNHFVVLRNSPTLNVMQSGPEHPHGGRVMMRVWSWGRLYDLQIPMDVFTDNYYGAIIGRLRG